MENNDINVKNVSGGKKTNKLNKKEWCWILYDVGNSAFTMVACSLFGMHERYPYLLK